MVSKLKIFPKNMEAAALKGYPTATDLADYLVKKGMTFRAAHGVVAKAVKFAIDNKSDLSELELKDLKKFSKLIEEDVFNCLALKGSIESRKHIGGTSFNAVKAALKEARAKLSK